MRNYKKKTNRTEICEKTMAKAVSDVLNGSKIRTTARIYGLKVMTLANRVKKYKESHPNIHTASVDNPENEHKVEVAKYQFSSKYTVKQVFTKEQEDMLVEYLVKSSKIQYGLSYKQIRVFAYDYAKKLGANLKGPMPEKWLSNKMAGEEWMLEFMKRHPNLSLRKPENTSLSRATAFNHTNVTEFFNNFEEALTTYNIRAERLYNIDETGIHTVLPTPKVVAETGTKQVGQAVSAERGELVTFCAIISATGNTIPPAFVFPRVRNKEAFLDGAPIGSLGLAAPSGYMNGQLFLQVMKHVQKFTRATKDDPILILLDNHESHASLEVIDFCRENGIHFVTFPPHCTHRLQPLDVGLYGPLKVHLKTAFNDWHLSHPGKTISIYNIAQLANTAYMAAFSLKNITSSFRKTGIWPVNRNIFTDDDFFSSYVTDQPEPSTSSDISLCQTEFSSTLTNAVTTLSLTNNEMNTQNPGSSSTSYLQNCEQPVTPESVRPYPKAVRCKSNNARRQRKGKSRILTSTPEKNRLVEEALRRSKKIKPKGLTENSTKRMKQAPKLPAHVSETESETDDFNYSLHSSEDSISDGPHEEEYQLIPPKIYESGRSNISVSDYVLVKFAGKKSFIYYVGQIEIKNTESEFSVKYLRKKADCSKFYFPEEVDSSITDISDICFILPQPTFNGGTARAATLLSFPVELSEYYVH